MSLLLFLYHAVHIKNVILSLYLVSLFVVLFKHIYIHGITNYHDSALVWGSGYIHSCNKYHVITKSTHISTRMRGNSANHKSNMLMPVSYAK